MLFNFPRALVEPDLKGSCSAVGPQVRVTPAAVRKARARTVSTGFTPPFVTCNDASATQTLSWP